MATISSSDEDVFETISTLRFAERCKTVMLTPVSNTREASTNFELLKQFADLKAQFDQREAQYIKIFEDYEDQI